MDLKASGAERRNYFASIQVLRGVAALLVVLYHLVDAERIYGKGGMLLDGLCRLGFAGVDIFFVISGFVMTTIAAGSYRSMANAGTFLCRRAVRVVPLYWIFTTVIVAMMVAAPHALDVGFQSKNIVASYLLWPTGSLPLLQVGWTLTYEAFFYVMMAIAIASVAERFIPMYLSVWALAVLVLQMAPNSSPAISVVTSPMTWEFIAGAGVGILAPRCNGAMGRVFFWAGVVGFCTSALTLDHLNLVEQLPMRRTLSFGVPSVFMVLGLAVRELARASKPHRILRSIGDASYSIYLSHLFVITLAARLWARTGYNTTLTSHCAFVLSTMALAAVSGFVCYAFVEKPLLKFGNRFVHRVRMHGRIQPA